MLQVLMPLKGLQWRPKQQQQQQDLQQQQQTNACVDETATAADLLIDIIGALYPMLTVKRKEN